ncbi:MAG: VTT domain-containing protein [Calditrichia bacterium]
MVVGEITFVALLLLAWFVFEEVRTSKHLAILFLYSFPSQFLIAVVPHEPVYFYFSKFYSPLTITMVATAGLVLTEFINYHVFDYFADFNLIRKAKENRYVQKLIRLFNKAPFWALFIAALTPIPFYPFRFIVVLARYSLLKYLLAVFISRSIRLYIFALVGKSINLSDNLLLLFFLVLLLVAVIQMLQGARKWRLNRADTSKVKRDEALPK